MHPLAIYLRDRNITQAGFAELIGVSQASVSKLLRGANQPSLDLAFRIERATGGAVPAGVWVGRDPKEDAA